LHLDTANRFIGINQDNPQASLHLSSPLVHDQIEVTNLATFDEVTFGYGVADSLPNLTTISTVTGNLNIEVADIVDPTIQYQAIRTSDIIFNDNRIQGFKENSSIILNPNGTGITVLENNTSILGNLTVNGNINISGNLSSSGTIYIGDSPFDVVTVNPDFDQTIIPSETGVYDLGSNPDFDNSSSEVLRWNHLYITPSDNLQNTTPRPQYVNFSGNINIGPSSGISSSIINTNLVFNSASNITWVKNLKFENSSITNTLDTPTIFSPSGNGYLKFEGTYGIRVPVGSNSQREFTSAGEIRWNTDLQYLEVYNGQDYTPSTGFGLVTEEMFDDISNIYSLILG
jgi:hypothetical protein